MRQRAAAIVLVAGLTAYVPVLLALAWWAAGASFWAVTGMMH